MKKIMMMLAMALTISTSFAFTDGEEPISKKVLNAFKTEFASATNAVWTTARESYKVTFSMGDRSLFAFYNASGELIAVTRSLSSLDLPLRLQTSLQKYHTNSWITDLFEVSNQDGTSYYVALETADIKIILESTDGGNWMVYQKVQKA
jgi:hypothetical protein